jgi:cytochrome c-type biogenesis protein CcmH/NrfG
MFIKAWYREGEAALELEEYEDAALAFFEGLQVDGDNADLKRMFDLAIARGREAAAKK